MGRLDIVKVTTDTAGLLEISWADREQIVELLENVKAMTTVARFRAVGATRPVELERDDKVVVCRTLARENWGEISDDLHTLTRALRADVDE